MLTDDYLVLKLEQEINVNENERANINLELKSAYKTTTDNKQVKC